ncbi:MAG: TGS domain-containing protein, partial [Clostridiales bacterium]|nr:TGS domain-containing protein [Clostridiales bacterium]
MQLTLKNGKVLEAESGLSAAEITKRISEGLFREALCVKLDGRLADLSAKIENDCRFEVVTFDDDEGKSVYRHTAAHVLAQAVNSIYPTVKLAIGPSVENGFYYDFDFVSKISAEDFQKIEAEMNKIIKADFVIEKFSLSKADAIKQVKKFGEDYKLELINDLPDGSPVTFYRQGDFVEMCRGPHLPSTGKIKAFKLTSIAGAYWRGNEKIKML